MADHVMRELKPPQRLGHEGKPITVGDKVRVRDGKTSDYCPAVVKSIEVDGMMVQWESDDGPGAYVNVPLGSVRGKGADGDYGDGCSVLWCFLAFPDTHTCANTSCCNVYSCIICSLSGLVSVNYLNYLNLRNTLWIFLGMP